MFADISRYVRDGVRRGWKMLGSQTRPLRSFQWIDRAILGTSFRFVGSAEVNEWEV